MLLKKDIESISTTELYVYFLTGGIIAILLAKNINQYHLNDLS
jgi:hypothetical protein